MGSIAMGSIPSQSAFVTMGIEQAASDPADTIILGDTSQKVRKESSDKDILISLDCTWRTLSLVTDL
jgi:hypothetical protein